MTGKICVIIPFFQRERGILPKAVASALAQEGLENFCVLVVDDGSPIAARDELAEYLETHGNQLFVIEQENKGCPGAKNTALDNLPAGTEYVAILDSDDEWTSDHLANSLRVLDAGYDFYFSDFYQLGQNISAFNRAKKINVADHPNICDTDHLHHYVGNMIDQIIMGNVLGCSVTVYSFKKFPKLRFREDFINTGEEYVFWLELALKSEKIGFSSRCECRYGSGVNVFAEASWGTEKFLVILASQAKYFQVLLNEYPLSDSQRHFVKNRIKTDRETFVMGVLHNLRVGKWPKLSTLWAYGKEDKAVVILFLPLLLKQVYRKIVPSTA